MYCLRILALLVFLPFPTEAPPILLAVWLASMLLHTRPCLYCSALVIGFFAASCGFDLATSTADGVVNRCWLSWNPSEGSLMEPRMPLAISAVNATMARITARDVRKQQWALRPIAIAGERIRDAVRATNIERTIGIDGLQARLWFGLSVRRARSALIVKAPPRAATG